jgi:hypothetical protein
MAALRRGTPSARRSRTAGAVRATTAAISAEPWCREVGGWGSTDGSSERGMRLQSCVRSVLVES